MSSLMQQANSRYQRESFEDLEDSKINSKKTANRPSTLRPNPDSPRDKMTVAQLPSRASGNEKIYEAYNDLHALAQVFEKPFDAPAILVVGHQTDGKSSLVEGLMGFQFNHVGGGTKTRRPITLHMKYNAACVQPSCYLITDDMNEQEMALEDLQEYIEQENARLEREAQFWAKEIVVKIEYKFCPNLTIIDTPGLISAAPGKKNCPLQNSSKQVEAMVRGKMEVPEYIILCLEDTNDWTNATTRKLVMQVDPQLQRTVLVSTKFDTKIPQFSRGADVDMFIKPASVEESLGGGPFFTSVPSGRVGTGKDYVYRSNEHFREAVADRELQDVSEIETKMGRKLDKNERAHLGVGQLRRFLEQLLQRRYLDNVPTIVPLLEREARSANARLEMVHEELNGLNPEKLKEKGRAFMEAFLTRLSLILRGTVTAPTEKFGETLSDEHIRGGAFVGPNGKTLATPESLPNANMRLFGGAQFHRAMSEFRTTVGQICCPDVTREEIANACGLDDFHDGVNYVRTACVIAVSKARELFEPFLHQLGYRLSHVLRRLLPISMFLLQKDGTVLGSQDFFVRKVGSAFHAFIDEVEKSCMGRCLEDLQSTTRYVTWSLHTKGTKSIRNMLTRVKLPADSKGAPSPTQHPSGTASTNNSVVDMLENTLWNRQLNVTSEEIVGALVCQIFEGIRDHVIQAAELKFNCFFLMPVVDDFPARLRHELESSFEEDLDEVFDVSTMRCALEIKAKALQAEVTQVERLQRKFTSIHSTLAKQETMMSMLAGLNGLSPGAGRGELDIMSLADTNSMAPPAPSMVPKAPRVGLTGPRLGGPGDDSLLPKDVALKAHALKSPLTSTVTPLTAPTAVPSLTAAATAAAK